MVLHQRQVDAELAELRIQFARMRLLSVTAKERVRRCVQEIEELQATMAEQRKFLDGVAMQEDLRPLSREIASLLDRLGAVGVSGADIDYAGFEDLFRGESGDLRKAQERYLSLFPSASEPGKVVDIGCGRGEMLALLQREGHDALGVDTDRGMVDLCLEQGLPAVLDDGIHFLSQTPDDSLKGIFSAQVVEHLITPELEQLVRLALRTLRRGGVFVVETINPRSSFALGNHFYADTSHVRPVHPETLRFICQQVGFRQVQLEERSPHPSLELVRKLPADAVGEAVGTLLDSVFGYPGLRDRRHQVNRYRGVHQFHSGTALGDAITNQMLGLQVLLQGMGYQSEIFAEHIPTGLAGRVRSIHGYPGSEAELLLVHHSIGHDAFDRIIELPNDIATVYHNVTPEEYFANEGVRHYIRKGREQLRILARRSNLGVAVSNFNRREMLAAGFHRVEVLPVRTDYAEFEQVRWSRDRASRDWLFVGRLVGNKCQHELVGAFAAYARTFDAGARLVLVGDLSAEEYVARVRGEAQRLGVADRVVLLGKVTDDQLRCRVRRRGRLRLDE